MSIDLKQYLNHEKISLFLSSCSSVKVMDPWKSDSVKSINDKSILVIARTQNKQARIAFENEIVKQLTIPLRLFIRHSCYETTIKKTL